MAIRLAVDRGGPAAGVEAIGEVWVEVLRVPPEVPQWVSFGDGYVRLFLHDRRENEHEMAAAKDLRNHLKGST
jgi:hypothetical protein